jgi:tetratricopeptide (TPR) repeat protein
MLAYGQALQHPKTQASANLNLGRLYLEAKDPKSALQHLDRGLAEQPNFALGYVHRAQALLALGQLDKARNDLEKAVVIEPQTFEGWMELAKLRGAQRQYREALEALAKVRSTAVYQAEATFLAIDYHRQLGQSELAIAELEALTNSQPYLGRGFFELGKLLLERNDHREAERRLRKGLELEPGHRAGRLDLALSLERSGRWSLAVPEYEAVVAGAKTDSDPLAQLARQGLARRPK